MTAQSELMQNVQRAMIDAEGPVGSGEDAFYGPMAMAAIAVVLRDVAKNWDGLPKPNWLVKLFRENGIEP